MKYKLTDESVMVEGQTLYRIRALRDFGTVRAGDLGGFVASEANLSQEGLCWVAGNACIFGSAWVCCDAWVADNAWIFGRAQVSMSARVCGDAHVSGSAWLSGGTWESSPLQIQGSRHYLTVSAPGVVTIGCITLPLEEWLRTYREVGVEHGYTPEQIEEYGRYLRLVEASMSPASVACA